MYFLKLFGGIKTLLPTGGESGKAGKYSLTELSEQKRVKSIIVFGISLVLERQKDTVCFLAVLDAKFGQNDRFQRESYNINKEPDHEPSCYLPKNRYLKAKIV